MFNIKKMNAISNTVCDYLTDDTYVISEETEDYDAILVRSAKCHDLCVSPTILRQSRGAGAGVNNIPDKRMYGKGHRCV